MFKGWHALKILKNLHLNFRKLKQDRQMNHAQIFASDFEPQHYGNLSKYFQVVTCVIEFFQLVINLERLLDSYTNVGRA